MTDFKRVPYKKPEAQSAFLIVEVVTPLHIGTGERLAQGIDYFASSEGLRMFDLGLVFDALCEVETPKSAMLKMEETNVVAKRDGNIPLDWIDRQNPLEKERFRKTVSRCIQWQSNPMTEDPQELRACLTSGNGSALLAGSSLKGAIRGVILDHLVEGEKARVSKEFAGDLPQKDRIFDPLFSQANPAMHINFDMLRLLRVGDAEFPLNCTEAVITKTYNLTQWESSEQQWAVKSSGGYHSLTLSQYVEAVPKGATCAVRIELGGILRHLFAHRDDSVKADRFPTMDGPQADMATLLALMHAHTQRHIEREIEFWHNDHSKSKPTGLIQAWEDLDGLATSMGDNVHEALIRVGQGGGYLGITGAWQRHLEPEKRHRLLNSKKKYKGNEGQTAQPYFPKSRKTGIEQPMGFLKLRLVSEADYLAHLKSQNQSKEELAPLPDIAFTGKVRQNTTLKAIYLGPVTGKPNMKRFRLEVNGEVLETALAYQQELPTNCLVKVDVKALQGNKITQVGNLRIVAQ